MSSPPHHPGPPTALLRFGKETLDDDICALFTRRAYDMAGCTHHTVKVYLNGKRLATNNFSNYVDLFLGPKVAGLPRTFEKVSDRWEVAIAPEPGREYPDRIGFAPGDVRRRARNLLPIQELLPAMEERNKQLEANKQTPMVMDEMIAARLYTGPM